MKKSDALKLILEILFEYNANGKEEYPMQMQPIEECILGSLEDLGMIPPECEDWMSLDDCREFYGEDFEPGNIWDEPRKNVRRWESEE